MKNGDILLSRYLDDSRNTTPGKWNHSAIYHNGSVIEAIDGQGVCTTEYYIWKSGVEQFIVLRPVFPSVGKLAGNYAPSLIGNKYRLLTSVFRHIGPFRIKKGLNCVSVVRLCYKHAFKDDPKWTLPDHILGDGRFKEI